MDKYGRSVLYTLIACTVATMTCGW